MNEKRFTFGVVSQNDVEIKNNGEPMNIGEVVDKLNEQQATIRKLQDLCGESDSENAKLRIENKELQEEIKLLKPVNIEQYEQIVQLQEENEKLRQQMQIYEQLISNSYVGEEETLDGFVGKYVIWEDELQKYREKTKKVMTDE